MAQATRRYKLHKAALDRQAYFRSGDERTILKGWSGLIEHHVGRLEGGGMSEADVDLALDALDNAWVRSARHMDDIMNSKAPPHYSAADLEKFKLKLAAIVEEAPWARPAAVKPKGQWGGKR